MFAPFWFPDIPWSRAVVGGDRDALFYDATSLTATAIN